MIRDITIGQYYPVKSVIHELDPRVKIIGTLLFAVSLFLLKNAWSFLPAAILLVCCIRLSHIPVRFIARGMKPIVLLLLITAAFNLFLTPGNILVQFWIFKITEEGLRVTILTVVRLCFLVFGTSLMTFTTTPNRLTDGRESLLSPLQRFHVPVQELALVMSIALRFIPILLEETDKIMKAQIARGADFESGNLLRRMKNMIPLLVPLFVSAFRRADDLAMAMEARGYHGGAGRTKMKPLRYSRRDAEAFAILALYVVSLVLSHNIHNFI